MSTVTASGPAGTMRTAVATAAAIVPSDQRGRARRLNRHGG